MRHKLPGFLTALALGLLVPVSTYATTISVGGGDIIQSFGKDNTQTYGQTIVAPVDSILNSFSFWLGRTSTNFPDPSTPSLSFMAYVYSWNEALNQAAGAALYTSAVVTHDATTSTPFTQYTFPTGGLALTPGDAYVLFLSTSGLAGTGRIQWELFSGGDGYADGKFVFMNNGEDTSAWTTSAWLPISGSDLHFEADFGTAAVPEPATLLLLGTGLGVGLVRRRMRARG